MNYPCGLIRDLLPLYIDAVCNEDSKKAVSEHLLECEECRKYYEVMNSAEGYAEVKTLDSKDSEMLKSLKNIKRKINKKNKRIVLCAVAVFFVLVLGYNLLFSAALKKLSYEDVSVSAEVYSLTELAEDVPQSIQDPETVKIYADEDDKSDLVEVNIPQLGKILLTEETIEKNGHITVISISSEYFLKASYTEIEDDTLYITALKTTLLGNKAEDYQRQNISFEFKEINRIVFVDKNGMERELWSKGT